MRSKISKIFLVGFMGSGKTVVGELLAEKLKFRFIDLDREMEKRENLSIPEIFAKFGEEYFRDRESSLLSEVAGMPDSIVVATGGGIVERKENRDILKRSGINVWLDVSFGEIVKRGIVGDSSRPLSKEGEILIRYEKRIPLYREVADITVKVDGKEVGEIVEEIWGYLRERFQG